LLDFDFKVEFKWHNSDTTSCLFCCSNHVTVRERQNKVMIVFGTAGCLSHIRPSLDCVTQLPIFPFEYSILFEYDVKLQNYEHIQAVMYVFMNKRYCDLLQKEALILVQLRQLSISPCFHTALVHKLFSSVCKKVQDSAKTCPSMANLMWL